MTPLWAIPALAYLCFVQGQSMCTNPRGQRGVCKSIYECEYLRTLVNKPGKTQDEVTFLQRSGCGFNGSTPLVCCPNSAPPNNTRCSTPEGNQGQCISIFNCEHIAKRLESPIVSQEYRNYVTSLRCDGPGYSVCCGPPVSPNPPPTPHLTPPTPRPAPPTPRPTSPTPPPTRLAEVPLTIATPSPLSPPSAGCVPSAEPPNPATECCGIDGVGANKITGGNATGIDQYPWLVLIEYIKTGQGKIKLLCGGVLISGRYVLTAGHCVVGPVLNSGTPTNVRLGEYDTSNSGPDCVSVEGGDPGDLDCSPEPVVIPIERVIPHPDYQPRNPLRRNDIALLRLKQTAPYTDFVRPICLPTRDVTLNFPEEDKLFAAGWGAVNETLSASPMKLHVDLPYKTLQECQPAYTSPSRRVRLWAGQICAGGEPGKDSCKGDSGGPLMYTNGTIYDVVGIVSFGPTPCGLNNVPGVYTKVFEYLPWIRSNIVA